MNIQSCRNTADAVPLYLPQGLYLKPIARIHMSVSLPNIKSGKSISNWEVMEKMRFMIQPDTFTVLKATNSTMEFIRFEGEIEDRTKLDRILARLDGRQLKLTNISDNLRVRAAEAKTDFPSQHDWNSFFRDAKNMNENKPGERPDTIHISNLPTKWFVYKSHVNEEHLKPSERIFCKAFERFGTIRNVDIPICDPYRHLMKPDMSGMKTFNFDQEMYFEGYVQYEEYMGFVRAMDALRGMKLLFKDDHESFTVNIGVDFDKNKHLSDACIRRRKIVRDRYIAIDKDKEEKARKEAEEEKKKKEKERQIVLDAEKVKEDQRRQREEQRKAKQLELLKKKETEEISHKIALEEKKLLITQRKLESIRLLEELFNRIKLHPRFHESKDSNKNKKKIKEEDDEKRLRDVMVSKYKTAHEKQLKEQKAKIREMEGANILKKILQESEEANPSLRESMSMTSLSSENSESESKKHKKTKKKKKKSKKKKHKDSSDSEDDSPSKKDTASNSHLGMPPNPGPWFGFGPPNGGFPFPGHFFPPPVMSRGGPFFNRPYNPGSMRGMRGSFRSSRPFNPNWRGRGRGGLVNQQIHPHYYEEDDEYTRYFKRISGTLSEDKRSYSRSYSRSRSRSRYSRSRSRSRSRRSYSRSRSRSRRSRSRSRRSRSRSRRSRSHSKRSRSRRDRSRSRKSRSRSRSRYRSRSRSRSSRSKQNSSRSRRTRSRSNSHKSSEKRNSANKSSLELVPSQVLSNKDIQQNAAKSSNEKDKNSGQKNGSRESRSPSYKSIDSSKFISPNRLRSKRSRSRSWSLPRSSIKGKASSWSKSPSPSRKF